MATAGRFACVVSPWGGQRAAVLAHVRAAGPSESSWLAYGTTRSCGSTKAAARHTASRMLARFTSASNRDVRLLYASVHSQLRPCFLVPLRCPSSGVDRRYGRAQHARGFCIAAGGAPFVIPHAAFHTPDGDHTSQIGTPNKASHKPRCLMWLVATPILLDTALTSHPLLNNPFTLHQ